MPFTYPKSYVKVSAVTGELRGLEYLHTKYAKLPWGTLLSPPVELARNGFLVAPDTERYLAGCISGQPNENLLISNPFWAIDFALNGAVVKVNQTMTRK